MSETAGRFRQYAAWYVGVGIVWLVASAHGAVGDPQLRTDDPWYPGELSCSTFQRLFQTQAQLYQRVTGRTVATDEDRALASWYWRNLHYWHGEEGQRDCFNGNFGGDKGREYWTGLFADGFALCGTTHAQWCAEMDALLGHCRSRVVGVNGHNSFEVYLEGGAYGSGRWALLDHDISTVIYTVDGKRLMGLDEIVPQVNTLADPAFNPGRQHNWRIAGLYDDDAKLVYTRINAAEYLAGYAGPPPMVHLRSGERFRRYLSPGLGPGKTFVFWGRNANDGGIAGPSRDRTWVNQPQQMYGSTHGTGAKSGRVRYANAVYTYTPDFAGGSYKQGVIDESSDHVTFEFYTPYVIAATPPDDSEWGVYKAGCRNGLVIHGHAACPVSISLDQGRTWQDAGAMSDGMDLTDLVKGYQQYLLKFGAGADALKNASLSWQTVCQANVSTIPHLHDGTNVITYAASEQGIVAAGPTVAQAEGHVVSGKIGSDSVTMQLSAPRGATPTHLYAASWEASGDPPAPIAYGIDYSTDGCSTWRPVVKNWKIERRPYEPPDFWSQSFAWGDITVADAKPSGVVQVRFSNDGHKTYRRVEAYLTYEVANPSAADVTFAWTADGGGFKTATHNYRAGRIDSDSTWRLDAGHNVQTSWVQIQAR